MVQDPAQVAQWRRHARYVALAIAALLVVTVGGIIIGLASIDTDALKPRIAAAVERATGRKLLLNGPIGLGFSLWPSVHVTDVGFANPPGFSRPLMATLQRLDLQLALLPLLLHRIEIAQLVLVGPDLLLEINAERQTNWIFPAKSRPAANDDAGDRISIHDVRIEGGTIAYRDDEASRGAVLAVTELLMHAESPDAPLHLAMQARANGAAFSLAGEVGPVSRLQDREPGTPWPVKLQLAAGAATMTIDGSIGHLAKGRLYALQLVGSAPDIAPLSAFLPGIHLPSLRDASVTARLVDMGRHFELDTTLRIAGITLAAKGTIADTSHLAGVDIALTADAASIAAFSTLDHPLPPFRSIAFQARLTDAADGLALHDIKFTSAQADISGDAIAGFSTRPSLRAKLTAARIDAGALRISGNVAPPAQAQPGTAYKALPDMPLPLDLLRMADADIELEVGSLLSRRNVYESLAARLSLRDGHLRLAPFTVDLPEGQLTGTLSADVAQPNPQFDLTLHAPGLAVQPLLKALGLPEEASGKLRVSLELHGSGDTPHAIAAGLNGHLGLALVHGNVSNWLLSSTLGWMLREAYLPGLSTEIGSSELRCFALRMDFNHGVGELSSLLIDSSPLYLDGSGTIQLRDETLDLRLRPEPRMGGIGMVAPLRLSGTFSHPRVGPDLIATAKANVGILVSAAEWLAAPIGWAAEAVGIIGPRARQVDDCTGPLIQGRTTEIMPQPIPPLPPLQLAR